ncbi:MAG: substrate-binding domain-containing protein, partial [Methanomassiliicoccales archaeon]
MEKRTQMFAAVGVVAIIIIAALAVGLSQNNPKPETVTFKQKGSDTMLELATVWSDDYHKNVTTTSIEVSGGGSGVGITALINKLVDIAQSSRAMTSAERTSAIAAGLNPVEFPLAIDGIAIITNPGITNVTVLTMEQLRGIYNGTITNWNQVGGNNLAIKLYGRQPSSGTYQYFQEVVLLKGNYSASMVQDTGNVQILNDVKVDPGAIGYVGIGYAKEGGSAVNIQMLKANATATAYSPLNENAVVSGQYPLSRYLYLYPATIPTGAMKNYFLWLNDNSKGQAVAKANGFYAIPQDVHNANLVKLGETPVSITLKQKGSDTMLELATVWSDLYHENVTTTSIEVSGGGSGVGITALINKLADIAQSSRPMTSAEKTTAIAAGLNPIEFPVAIDGISIITNPSVTGISTLTMEQLRGLYNGTYTNWNQVGGNNLAVKIYGRQPSSGTYQYFQEVVLLKGNYSTNMIQDTGNVQILNDVKADAGAIGYVGIGYAKEGGSSVTIQLLKATTTSTAYSPMNETAVVSGLYPLARYLFLYPASVPTGAEKNYFLWLNDNSKG